MPPRTDDTPAGLKPYLSLGVRLTYRPGDTHAHGDCPLCGREGKFGVNLSDGRYKCLKGGCEGNPATFLRTYWKVCEAATTEYDDLVLDRRLLDWATLEQWGAVRSTLTGEWLLPGYGVGGKVDNLYRYSKAGSRMALKGLAGVEHALFSAEPVGSLKETVYVTEGPWDAMALWETLRRAKHGPAGLSLTANANSSLGAAASVVAVPGASVFKPQWAPLFAGRHVVLCYDNDHPKVHPVTGKLSPPAGTEGAKRAAAVLSAASQKPASVKWLAWGETGYDSARPDGCDVRDLLCGPKGVPVGPSPRVSNLKKMLDVLRPIPADWVGGRTAAEVKGGGVEVGPLTCSDWKTLQAAWRRAMKWPKSGEGLDHALAGMLASCASVQVAGEEQLWLKVSGPPSCGKTTLCEGLATAKSYVYSADTMTGLTSGYQSDAEGKENQSMVNRVRDKALVIKDADTVMHDPNFPKIMSQFRAAYDRALRTNYGNKMSASHEGLNFAVILCGTGAMKRMDASDLGERYIDCCVMHEVDEETEGEINRRKLGHLRRMMAEAPLGGAEGTDSPEKVRAKRLTGGYVEWLRANIGEKLRGVEMSDEAAEEVERYGLLVAYLRARPSKVQKESVQRELSPRLVGQYARLAYCLAVVLNRPAIDREVLARVRRCALDTAHGTTFDLAAALRRWHGPGLDAQGVKVQVRHPPDDVVKTLNFLRRIGAVQKEDIVGGHARYRLSDRLYDVFTKVVGDE